MRSIARVEHPGFVLSLRPLDLLSTTRPRPRFCSCPVLVFVFVLVLLISAAPLSFCSDGHGLLGGTHAVRREYRVPPAFHSCSFIKYPHTL